MVTHAEKGKEAETKVSPVVFFAFNRPFHTRATLDALEKNLLASQTDFIAYVDGPRSPDDQPLIDDVVDVIKSKTGFKSTRIVRRDANLGLAGNIIGGVTDIIGRYGSAIVIEDDIVTSTMFLNYMNDALEFYRNEPSVWHVSGYIEDIDCPDPEGFFFSRRMNCWGWATWADRWSHFEKDPGSLLREFDRNMIREFNMDGTVDFWSQVISNRIGKLNTWAVFWYATIFKHGALCLSPRLTYVNNIGEDGSGTHSGVNRHQSSEHELNEGVFSPPSVIEESALEREKLKSFYKKHQDKFIKRWFGKVKNSTRLILSQ